MTKTITIVPLVGTPVIVTGAEEGAITAISEWFHGEPKNILTINANDGSLHMLQKAHVVRVEIR